MTAPSTATGRRRSARGFTISTAAQSSGKKMILPADKGKGLVIYSAFVRRGGALSLDFWNSLQAQENIARRAQEKLDGLKAAESDQKRRDTAKATAASRNASASSGSSCPSSTRSATSSAVSGASNTPLR